MYNVNMLLGIVSGDFYQNKKCVLSLSKDSIVFPRFNPTDCNNLKSDLNNQLYNFFDISPNSEAPSYDFILLGVNTDSINQIIEGGDKTINILYGLTVPLLAPKDNYYWYDFDFNNISIPNELSIIGEIIRHDF